ncbi:MAG: ABC transporter substrate-binding protein [Oscillospiraceae bacterium]|nr:ABC transporter substrate-binding protein [Oscillospiraceae bacterium]
MKKLTALFTAAAILTLYGCSGELETVSAPQAEGTAVIGLSAPLSGRYFFTEAWGNCEADEDIRNLIYGAGTIAVTGENTLASDSGTLKSVTTREERDGGRTYIFTLNDGLLYSDGSPITAKDYVFSILLQSSKEFSQLDGADNTAYSHLVGWEGFSSGEREGFYGVSLLADNQFSITIQSSVLPYYQELSLIQVYPLPMSVLAPGCDIVQGDGGAEWTGVTAELLRKTILSKDGYRYCPSVTAGPYTLTSVSGSGSRTRLELTANPYFNGSYAQVYPSIETLEISCTDLSSRNSMGSYDLICGISGKEEMASAEKLLQSEDIRCLFYDSAEISALLFGPTVTGSQRQALAALLDQEACIDLLAGRWGSPVVGLNPIASTLSDTFYSELRRCSAQWNDPGLARQLLGGSEPTLTFSYNPSDKRGSAVAEMLMQTAEDSGLLTIELEELSTDALIDRQLSGDYELLFCNSSLSADDVPWNGPEILTGDVLTAAESMANTTGAFPSRYKEKWQVFQQAYQQDLPALGLCGYERCDLISSRLNGYSNVSAFCDWTTLILSTSLLEE